MLSIGREISLRMSTETIQMARGSARDSRSRLSMLDSGDNK